MRKDLELRHSDILKWIAENKSKTFICKELNCRSDTLHRYLKKTLDIEYAGNKGSKGINSSLKLNPEEYSKSTCVKPHILKLKLIEFGYKSHQCEICKLTTWLDKPIPIELDHIDGNRYNNELSNVRILCPNCHAQTPTFCRPKNSPT